MPAPIAPAGPDPARPALAPHAPANRLVAAYLAASALPLAAAVVGGRAAGGRLAAHAAMLALATWASRRRPAGAAQAWDPTWLAAWAPLLLVAPLYAELPHVAAGLGGRLRDATVIGWERALFGGESPARTLAPAAPWRALSETLHAGYLSYYLLIYGPPLRLWAAGRRRAFGETAFTVMLAFVCCYAAFVAFPVQGPWYEWPAPALPSGPARRAVEWALHGGSARGTAFPSSHVAVSVAQTLVTWRHARGLSLAAAACTLALAAGAVYGGLHYAVDVLAGALVGVVVGLAGPRLYARWVA